MTRLEERLRSGLLEAAKRIPETASTRIANSAAPRRSAGVWAGVAAVVAVLVLLGPILFLSRSDPAQPQVTSPSQEPVDGGLIPAEVGFEFADPEHVRLRFAQDLTLTCEGQEIVDNGGFDTFAMDIWIDHRAGYTRLGIDYPNGAEYDLILKGRPGSWEGAWGRGTDLGRSAGCRQALDRGGFEQSIDGWAFQDSSELWFTPYLKPVSPENGGVLINHESNLTLAARVGPRTYAIETRSPDGTRIAFEFTLDDAQIRVIGERRHVRIPDLFEASATIEVLESGPAPLPADIFDTSTFGALWGNNPVVTTQALTP